MWPLWLIIAVAIGSALAVTTSAVLVVVQVERKRHQKLVIENSIDRNLSQYHRPHLSITDVDFANIPRPGRSLRQSVQNPRRDSRFYSTMPSEDEIRSFPEGTAESLAYANYVHTGTDRVHQWLNPSKSKKLEKRKKKPIQLSISAPMARSPMSAITEQTESIRQGSPEPVELPAHTTPRVTPEKFTATQEALPAQRSHTPQSSMDSIIGQSKRENRISTRINNGNAIKSRSISLGSIAPPPSCPLPPVPETRPTLQARKPSLSRSISEYSTAYRDISLLNSPLTNPPLLKSTIITVQPSGNFSNFNFGLDRDVIQIIQVDTNKTSTQCDLESEKIPVLSIPPRVYDSAQTAELEAASPRTSSPLEWSLPVGLRHLGSSRTHASSVKSYTDSRPISVISSPSTDRPLSSHRPSPAKSPWETPTRPSSISSVDFFRRSVVGPNVPVLSPNSPHIRGHKRQNCIRISGLTPIHQAKKRLSSQLDRLAEAEETEAEIDVHAKKETSVQGSVKDQPIVAAPDAVSNGKDQLNVSKIRQPQALSLRVRRPGLLDREGSLVSPTRPNNDIKVISPVARPSNPIRRPKTTGPGFVYAGSPSSDPTKPLPPQQEYSPVSPSASLGERPQHDPSNEKVDVTVDIPDTRNSYSPASTSILFSTTTSPAVAGTTSSPKRNHTTSQLHGPRKAPPPSLRIRNGTHISPRSRQGAEIKSGSPIRKTSQSKISVTNTTRRSSVSTQDELHRKTALLKSLTHAAAVGKAGGLPEINLVKPNLVSTLESQPARTPSSRYVDSPNVTTSTTTDVKADPQPIYGLRQRSKTVGTTTLIPPKLRQESTYPPQQSSNTQSPFPNSPSNISIWEDASVRGDSDNESPTSRRSQNLEKLLNRRSKTMTATIGSTVAPVEKVSLWKLQQNADMITSRALAFNDNHNPSTSVSSGKSPKQNSRERKVSKLDGFWGDKTQTDQRSPVQSPGRIRAASNIMGPRQRAHTVSAAPPKVRYTQISTFRTEQGVGLGLDFGRTVPAAPVNVKTEWKLGNGGSVFLNDMERDGIGKLR